MDSAYIKELDSNYIMNTYGRYDVVIDHGKNATLFSADNKKYIDFDDDGEFFGSEHVK